MSEEEKAESLREKWMKLKASFSTFLLNPAIERELYMNAFDNAYTLMMFRQYRVIHDGLRDLIREHLQIKVELIFITSPKLFLTIHFFLPFLYRFILKCWLP
jgi:hypothetical protein